MILDVEAVKESSRVCIEEWGKALERLNEEERRYKEKFRSIRRKIRETEKEIRAEKENELKYLTLCDKLAVQKELAAAMEEVLRNISRCQKNYLKATKKTMGHLDNILMLWKNLNS
ncbi:unnamed protein product [Allacma fusca]|uniref:Uncharacterized protein n=1 Tax=Allacma fusca TaxID=39272 RepID=A0A8J2PIG8_9HEXA|nr:unnamed protein product [Allacma fusca]